MTPYRVKLLLDAEKFFKKAPNPISLRIVKRIKQVAADPLTHDTNIKKLKDLQSGYRLRVGDYRVIYILDHPSRRLIITKIDHRSVVYR